MTSRELCDACNTLSWSVMEFAGFAGISLRSAQNMLKGLEPVTKDVADFVKEKIG